MQVYKVGKCVVVVALALLLLSCASSPARLKPVEEVLGKGWVCYTAPDGYKLAGIVVEVTNDGKYIFDADYSSLSIETQSSIGSVTTNNTTTFGGVVRLLESFKAVDKDASFTADLTRKADLAVTYGGTMCWHAKNIDQLRSLNIDQAFYCVAHYATVDKSTRL